MVELIYQGCHSEADDLNAAIVMALGFKVVVLPRVAPGHGACTVPAERQGGAECYLEPKWTQGMGQAGGA